VNLKFVYVTGMAIIALFMGAFHDALAANDGATSGKPSLSNVPIFARVGNRVVTVREFDAAIGDAQRTKFYHGKPPEAEEEALRREVGQKLIDRAMLLIEAKRLKLKPDAKLINQQIEAYESANATNKTWKIIRKNGLPILKMTFEDDDMRRQLEERARKVKAPNSKQLRAYYDANLDKFTEPERVRVSVILIRVDPSSPDFDASRKKSEELIKQLKEGADFAELAALHSGDIESADQGGDMGYLHGGMLGGLASEVVSKLKPGELSEPTGMMEGFAIFKLTDRQQGTTKSFEEVKERTRDLYLKDDSDRAWELLIARLRKNTPVKVDESVYAVSENAAGAMGADTSVTAK